MGITDLLMKGLLMVLQLLLYVVAEVRSVARRLNNLTQSQENDTPNKKIPNHICVAIVENEVSVPDVGQMVLWSAMAGIKWISVWDPHGKLKHSAEELEMALARQQLQQQTQYPFHFYIGGRSIKESVSNKTISVSILSSEDGRGDIVQAARSFSVAVKNGEFKSSDLTEQTFSDWLSVQVPDLDLVLMFGGCDSLFGILPWQLRVSEIVKNKTHRHVKYQEYQSWLSTFSNCSRRFGR